eukprot:113012-Chlamydomonas_euryale.AAC.1
MCSNAARAHVYRETYRETGAWRRTAGRAALTGRAVCAGGSVEEDGRQGGTDRACIVWRRECHAVDLSRMWSCRSILFPPLPLSLPSMRLQVGGGGRVVGVDVRQAAVDLSRAALSELRASNEEW